MSITRYNTAPILVDITDAVVNGTIVKRKARRQKLTLVDAIQKGESPCQFWVEVVPYGRNEDGTAGDECPLNSVFQRKIYGPFKVDGNRLVDALNSGVILASRYAPTSTVSNPVYRPDADWQADIDRLGADQTVSAMYQDEWMRYVLRTQKITVDEFITLFIRMLDASGEFA